jgi:hypothetical protein
MDPERANKTAERIQRSLKILIITTVLTFIALLAMGVYVYKIAQDNTRALCAVKQEAEKRVVETNNFLKEHPEGIAGISPAVLKRGADNAQSTVDALQNVTCPPPTLIPTTTEVP